MAKREEDERIKQLKEAGVNIYSFSKLSTINTCLYCAWMNYVKGETGLNSVYTLLGNAIHDNLQSLMESKIDVKDIWPLYKKTIDEVEMSGYEFPKDFKGENSIKTRYLQCMEYFCKHYVKPEGEFIMEELLILKLKKNRAIIGYADLIKVIDQEKKICVIFDYKSSSEYKSKAIDEHGYQLLIYKMAMEQAGWTVLGVFWIFLKYSTITYTSLNGKTKRKISKHCDNTKIGQTLAPVVSSIMIEKGYAESDIDLFVQKLKESNEISVLPSEVKKIFKITPYVLEYKTTAKKEKECLEYIDKTVTKYESLLGAKESPWPAIEISKSNSFWCTNLCSYRKKCPELRDYISKLAYMKDSKDPYSDLF